MAEAEQTSRKTANPSSVGTSITKWVLHTILGGLLLILPFLVIAGLVHYVYTLFNGYIVEPIALRVLPEDFEQTFLFYLAPLISLAIVIGFLFLMGLLFRTRIRTLVQWTMGHVPGVSTIYSAIHDTTAALRGPPGLVNVDTVVLVPFPHPGARMAGYLMTRNHQPNGSVLVSVYIPIVLFPPSGYTVIIPEKDIVFTDWPTKDVWKLLLTGGLTLPPEIPFEPEEGNQEVATTSGKPADDQIDDSKQDSKQNDPAETESKTSTNQAETNQTTGEDPERRSE